MGETPHKTFWCNLSRYNFQLAHSGFGYCCQNTSSMPVLLLNLQTKRNWYNLEIILQGSSHLSTIIFLPAPVLRSLILLICNGRQHNKHTYTGSVHIQ